MAYKYLNDNGLKAYTKKVKVAFKNLHTPIAISTENTTESMAQNVRNIADFVAKAKAAGIADINGMVVTCFINDACCGVGYFSGDTSICGIETDTGLEAPYYFVVDPDGTYTENIVLVNGSSDQVTSLMLSQGARKPIILTPETTEVDEETYQKLFPSGITTNDVDVMFRIGEYDYGLFLPLESTSIQDGEGYNELIFAGIGGGMNLQSTFLRGYCVDINTGTPHQCTVTKLQDKTLNDILSDAGYLNKSILTPVPLTATTSTNKTQLDLFLSKVPNAQVMHCTYKGVYAGTLHKIGTDWFGQLVKNTNSYEDCICIKLVADGTVTEGTTSLAQVNAKLDNIIG